MTFYVFKWNDKILHIIYNVIDYISSKSSLILMLEVKFIYIRISSLCVITLYL